MRMLSISNPSAAPSRHRHVRRAFTLLEILVVLAIIGLVAGLAISKISGIYDDAKIQAARLFVQTSMKVPLTAYKMQMGDYPSTSEGLQSLITGPAARPERWSGKAFIEGNKIPLDPWGEPYQYACPGPHNKDGFDVWSKGPDHASGTDDDIGNWDRPSAGDK